MKLGKKSVEVGFKRMRSLQWRLVFIFISLTIVLVIPISILLKYQVESTYYELFKNDMEQGRKDWTISDSSSMQDLWHDLAKADGNKGSIYYFNITSEYKTYTIVDTTRLKELYSVSSDNTDDVVMSTDPIFNQEETRLKFINSMLDSDNFISVLASDMGNKGGLNRNDGRTYFDYAFRKGNHIIYFRYYSEDWQKLIEDFNNSIFISTFISILIALIIGYIMSKTITVPIERMMQKAEGMAHGDFDHMLEVKSDDEIGKLTRSFNYMASELKNTLMEISSEKNKIETILRNMTDGIIAFNIKGEVIHANPAAMMMFEDASLNMNFNDFAQKYNLGISIEDIVYLDYKGNREKNITVNDKFLRIYFDLFTDEDKKVEGAIAVIQDITEQQKLDQMRREFVANVSHELKTPLTTIGTHTETLLNGVMEDPEITERFLNVIYSESERMTRIVRDLLQLSSLDNKQMKWKMAQICLTDLVKKSVQKVELEAGNKKQKIESFVIGEIPEIAADADRIEQVLLNILTNSIKYTPEGGTITVYTGCLYSDVYVKVADTGIGIPKEDISRIFERFYRVDKARSREMGGTGLGLSIAQEIVQAHGGNIAITSEYGKGTEVTIKLPVRKQGNKEQQSA